MKKLLMGFGVATALWGCAYNDVNTGRVEPPRIITPSPSERPPVHPLPPAPVMTPEQARQDYEKQRGLTTDNPFRTGTGTVIPRTPIAKNPIFERSEIPRAPRVKSTKPTKKQAPVAKSNQNCGSLPSTCSTMSSCSQAYAALRCGMQKLDRDGDGIPCESLCQG